MIYLFSLSLTESGCASMASTRVPVPAKAPRRQAMKARTSVTMREVDLNRWNVIGLYGPEKKN